MVDMQLISFLKTTSGNAKLIPYTVLSKKESLAYTSLKVTVDIDISTYDLQMYILYISPPSFILHSDDSQVYLILL